MVGTTEYRFVKMDSAEELYFLAVLEANPALNLKSNTPSGKNARKIAWSNVLAEMNKNGSHNEKQLQKKWTNLKSRTLEKIRKRKETGGGSCSKLNLNEEKVLEILGENNPKVDMIPGAVEKHANCVLARVSGKCDNSKNAYVPISGSDSENDDGIHLNMPKKKEMEKELLNVTNRKMYGTGNELVDLERRRVDIEEQMLKIDEQRLNVEKEILKELRGIRNVLENPKKEGTKSSEM